MFIDFAGIRRDEERPEWVVLGDLGRGFTWERLNYAFRFLRDGATLLALHKNPSWFAGKEGFVLDAGAFVAALEYATGCRALVV
ncbi:MAG TPA: TIGR01458 family HAD-type hydrolase, partial [Candidatus Polarisedimenticolia bacterium]|nr:TIGR01458 family HAD-type hydrolase [Candidatus Polarisedimenticolia bacterium]